MGNMMSSYIEKRPTRAGDERAFIVGTRIRVQDIASDHERHGLSPDEIADQYPHLSLAQVHAALAYYFDNKDEIRGQMKADDAFVRSLESQAGSRSTPSSGKDAGPISS